ncbi:hypothetical protein PT974_00261 [Cladobotryum mycophilum]|uniref:ORC6 first cyclin-like domain-containing protein n=1 Tax=Cladobotryum mycophilum TaxID=491253 RepID=A0ABR0T1K2_9HYPO
MSKQIELALVSLMPTYGSDLPPSLVELAGSLLTQSRHLASTLKTEEEIARPYACAHIACDRLKITLDLPPIEPRPPIPPRVYKRLYTHLENTLPNAARNERGSRTPRSKGRDLGSSPGSQKRALPSRPTPSRETALAKFRKQTGVWIIPMDTARNTTPMRGIGEQETRSFNASGYGIDYHAWGRRTEDEWVLSNATALCAAIILFVAMRVKDLTPEQAMNRDIFVPARKEIIEQLTQARNEAKDFDAAVAQVNERGWLDADWYNDISDVMQFDQPPDTEFDDGDLAAQVQSRRADTMLQEKYDLLSETRRADYKTWKEKILARITEQMAVAEAKESS